MQVQRDRWPFVLSVLLDSRVRVHRVLNPPPAVATPGVAVSVAGITITLRAGEPGLEMVLSPAASRFPGAGSPDLSLTVRRGDVTRIPAGEPVFDSGGTWKLSRDDGALVFRLFSARHGATPFQLVRLRGNEGEIVMHAPFFPGGAPVAPFQFPLDELLFIHLLAGGRGALVHACGVVTRGEGLLFTGHSQDGKTTTSRHWAAREGARILSDDRIVLRDREPRPRMFGTPWHGEGEYAEAGDVPLRAVFVLEKAEKNRITRLGRADAVSRLLARAFVPFYAEDALEATLAVLDRVLARVPAFALGVVPDGSAREFVEREMGWLS